MKWFRSMQEATALLNDGWYSNTLKLVRAPAAEMAQQALVEELFPAVSRRVERGREEEQHQPEARVPDQAS